jgi:hypothetical protein
MWLICLGGCGCGCATFHIQRDMAQELIGVISKKKIFALVYIHSTHPTRKIDGSAGITRVLRGFLGNKWCPEPESNRHDR